MPRRRLYILGATGPGHTRQRPPRGRPASSVHRSLRQPVPSGRLPRRPSACGRDSCRPGRGVSGGYVPEGGPGPRWRPAFLLEASESPGLPPCRLAHSARVDAPQAPRAREHEITSDLCRDGKEGNKNIPLTAQSSVPLKVCGRGERRESAGRGGERGGDRRRCGGAYALRRGFVMVPESGDPRSSCSLAIT